jgi:hypothetical protein
LDNLLEGNSGALPIGPVATQYPEILVMQENRGSHRVQRGGPFLVRGFQFLGSALVFGFLADEPQGFEFKR